MLMFVFDIDLVFLLVHVYSYKIMYIHRCNEQCHSGTDATLQQP